MQNHSQKIVALLGPTNTGKTHVAIEKMLKFDSGIFGLPLRLLAREVYDKCVEKIGSEKVALITGEEKIIPASANYFICTVESMPKKKDVDFIGKKALEKIKREKIKNRFAMFTLKESEPGKPLLLHDEPIYIDDKIVGRSTSGNYSFNYKKNLIFGYILNDFTNDELQSKNLFIEVEKQKYSISIQSDPLKRTDFKNL